MPAAHCLNLWCRRRIGASLSAILVVLLCSITFVIIFAGACSHDAKNSELTNNCPLNNKPGLIVSINNNVNCLNRYCFSFESLQQNNKEGDCLYISLLYSIVINYREGMIRRITSYDILGNKISDCFIDGDKIDGTLCNISFDSKHVTVSSLLTFKNGELISEENYYKDELDRVYQSMINYNNAIRLNKKAHLDAPVSVKAINGRAVSANINDIESGRMTLDCFSEIGEKVATFKSFLCWLEVLEYSKGEVTKINYFDLWGNLLGKCTIDDGKANGTEYSILFGLRGLKHSMIVSFKDGKQVSEEYFLENEIEEIVKALEEYKKKIRTASYP